MKKSIILLALLTTGFAACNNEQSKETENKDLLSTELVNNPRSASGSDAVAVGSLATMDFRDSVYDYGTINEGATVSHDFEFTNNGKSPLIISNASGSCGCTVADYPDEPVAPGKSSKITVQFSSKGKTGHQEKSVTLTTNSNRGTHQLFIKGEVKPASN
ncbi:MAG: DUF1573 domain-containing protein [Sphingobacteriales bacterium]|nr:MAG: DUF1573 domain-containing protein [Sphingobacteriales bacterium]